MATLKDNQAELENYPLWNWQPVKIVTSVGVIRSNLRFGIMSCAAECKTDWRVFVSVVLSRRHLRSATCVTHCCSSRGDWLSVRAPESWLSLLSVTASQTVAAGDGRNVQGPERGG